MSQDEAGFELHAQLARDCTVVGDLRLSRVLLMSSTNWGSRISPRSGASPPPWGGC
jgi:hypothetical protein